jgi:thiol-disulfide isomerase/thioredoxin
MKSSALAFGVAAALFVLPAVVGADTHVKGVEPLRVSHGDVIHIQDYLVPGKTTIFDFYSDFCPPCRALKPSLEKLHASRDDIALVVVDINRPGVRGIDWNSPVARQYQLHSIPHLAIFGPDGKLVAVDQDRNPAARRLVTRWISE